jgi:hypothetical protein
MAVQVSGCFSKIFRRMDWISSISGRMIFNASLASFRVKNFGMVGVYRERGKDIREKIG